MDANKQNSGKTKVLPLFSTYGTFCSNDVLDAPQAVSDRQRSIQCCKFMEGIILIPFAPVMIVCDIVSYPFRLVHNVCKK